MREAIRSAQDHPSGPAADATVGEGSAIDLGLRLIPGALPIAHAPYGTEWDSTTPLVLTGERVGWPAKDWG